MQKKWNTIPKLTIFFIVMFILLFIPTRSNAAQTEELNGVTAILSDDGILTISGSGEIKKELIRKFNYQNEIKNVVIEEGITSIGNRAFNGCNSLESIIISEGVTRIGDIAFENCSSLSSITIPSSVTNIGTEIFCECIELKTISVDDGNEKYTSENGILFNKNKTEIIWYPAGKEETSYMIPSGVTRIKWYAFYKCINLTNITIPSTVQSIGERAFMRMY